MALYPEEFPQEQQQIWDHVKECPSCRKEFAMLQDLQEAMRKHRRELADSVSPCPSSSELVDYSLGESHDPSVEAHLEHCCDCREQSELVKQLLQESPAAVPSPGLTPEEKLIIRNAALKECGLPATKEKPSLAVWLRSLLSALHVPSIAIGAAVAALLVVALAPWTPREAPSRLVLSDTRWESPVPESMTKTAELFTHPKKVALIIMVQDGAGLSANEVGQLYGKANPAGNVGDQYQFMSPGDVKKALDDGSVKVADVPAAARMVLAKTDADYVLAFRVGGSGAQVNVAGSLFERPHKRLLGFASWDGVPKERLSDKIIRIGAELLSGAGQS